MKSRDPARAEPRGRRAMPPFCYRRLADFLAGAAVLLAFVVLPVALAAVVRPVALAGAFLASFLLRGMFTHATLG